MAEDTTSTTDAYDNAGNEEMNSGVLHTLLCEACERGSMDVVRFLVEQRGADICAREPRDTPFQCACSWYFGNPNQQAYHAECDDTHEICQYLLERYTDRVYMDQGNNSIHWILRRYLIHTSWKRKEPTAKDFPPNIICKYPTRNHIIFILRRLLDHHDEQLIHVRDTQGRLPLHAVCRGMPTCRYVFEIMMFLLHRNVKALAIADARGRLPIHVVCKSATIRAEGIRFLVDAGGPNTLARRDANGDLPLHVLCRQKLPSVDEVQCIVDAYPRAVATRTPLGDFPVTLISLLAVDVGAIYILVRAYPEVVCQNTTITTDDDDDDNG